jgi:hypothetical protein
MSITLEIKSEKVDRLLDALCELLEAEPVDNPIKPAFTTVPPSVSTESGTIPSPPVLTEPGIIPPPPVDVELDSAGLPWDARIHGKAKGKLAKTQEWKKIRGIDKNLVAQVEAELRAKYPAPNTTTGTGTPPDTGTAKEPSMADKIMANIALWIGGGTFTADDVNTVLAGLNIPNLEAVNGLDDNVLSILNYNLINAWNLKNTPK